MEAHSGVVGAPCGAPGDLEGEPCGWGVVRGWQEVEVGGMGVGR